MTPETFVDEIRKAMPIGLRSVVLYGSAAAGDHVAGRSDYNVLVIADRLGLPELQTLSRPARAWARAGNRPPLLFTAEQLRMSADAFPIELLDIRQSHRVLYGEDLIAAVAVRPEHLRLQVERELKGKLLYLRERYLLASGKRRLVLDLLTSSLSTFQVLFRAALRLWQDEVPTLKHDAVQALAGRAGFDLQPFACVRDLKEKRLNPRGVEANALFGAYLAAIEQVVEAVDSRVRQPRQSAREEGGVS